MYQYINNNTGHFGPRSFTHQYVAPSQKFTTWFIDHVGPWALWILSFLHQHSAAGQLSTAWHIGLGKTRILVGAPHRLLMFLHVPPFVPALELWWAFPRGHCLVSEVVFSLGFSPTASLSSEVNTPTSFIFGQDFMTHRGGGIFGGGLYIWGGVMLFLVANVKLWQP